MPSKEIETQINNTDIKRLGAAVRIPNMGRNNTLYLGWTEGGAPILSWENTALSDAARESLNITKTVKLSSNVSISNQPIEAVQYMASLPSIDKPDIEDEFTQDVLVLGVANNHGLTDYVRIEELDLMKGILNGHVVWQDVNSRTVLGNDEVTPTLPMHSVFLPIQKEDGKNVVYAMLFEPTMASESNEPAFKLFLAQTLKSFLALDARQPKVAKKGYEDIISGAESLQGTGGDAYFIMNLMKDVGFEVSRDRLERVRRESVGKGFVYQLAIVAREFGFLDFQSKEGVVLKGRLDSMKVESLLDLMDRCYNEVSQTFRHGK